jgi:(p)ppGpp synthase/HD superfamily hydrolase
VALVEVIVDNNREEPDKKWLSFCGMEARRMIEKQLVLSERDRMIEMGRNYLRDEVLVERGILEIRDLDERVVSQLLGELGCWYGTNDLYYKVAMGMDLEIIRQKLDGLGIGVGVYTTVQIEGENVVGVAKDVATILAKNKADSRNVIERVSEDDKFTIRILMKVDYKGKKKIEEELKRKYSECVIV